MDKIEERKDPNTGATYYYNTRTEKSGWTREEVGCSSRGYQYEVTTKANTTVKLGIVFADIEAGQQKGVKVKKVEEHSPLREKGVEAEDRLLKVSGDDVTRMALNEVMKKIVQKTRETDAANEPRVFTFCRRGRKEDEEHGTGRSGASAASSATLRAEANAPIMDSSKFTEAMNMYARADKAAAAERQERIPKQAELNFTFNNQHPGMGIGVADNQVVVLKISEGGEAKARGMKVDDIVLEINEQSFRPFQMSQLQTLRNALTKRPLHLKLLRQGGGVAS